MATNRGVTDVSTGKLVMLGDTDLTVADPREDIRGRKVLDRQGEDLGQVDGLLIDESEAKVRFLRVASGGFLGLGEQAFLLPIDAITDITRDHVRVDQTREQIAGAPAYDPELANDRDYYGSLYGYYGYGPYWGPGYVYPPYPLYL